MREKLIRNTSDERWRLFWSAVDAAAAKAPTLRFQEKKAQSESSQGKATKKSAKTKK